MFIRPDGPILDEAGYLAKPWAHAVRSALEQAVRVLHECGLIEVNYRVSRNDDAGGIDYSVDYSRVNEDAIVDFMTALDNLHMQRKRKEAKRM